MNRGVAEERKERGKGGRERSPPIFHMVVGTKNCGERRPVLNDPTMTTSSFGPRYYPHPRRNIPPRVVFQLGSGWDDSRRGGGEGMRKSMISKFATITFA